MLSLRLCYLKLHCLFDEKCYLPFSVYKELTDTLLSGFNVSRVAKPTSLQSPIHAEGKDVDKCLLSIERNESDVILLPYTMPVIMSNIKTGPVFFSDKIAIASTYKVENDNPYPGIFDTFDAFRVDACALILNFFVILAILISLTYILERKSPCSRIRIKGRQFKLRFVPWFIFRFFVKQYPSLPGNMTALKVLLTCCVLMFSYFVTFFYSSMIKTDMVTVKTPRVIASYQDILDDPQIEPYIRYTFDEYLSFKDARSGSLKKKIWERILKMGVGRLVYQKGTALFGNSDHPFMHTKAVLMAYGNMKNLVKYSSGLFFKKLKIRKCIFFYDPNESEKLSSSIMNRWILKALANKYERRMRRYFEGHFYQIFLENAGLRYAEYYGDLMNLGKDISDVDQYASERVVPSEPELVKPNITYFMALFISYVVLCFIQFICFLFERLVCGRY